METRILIIEDEAQIRENLAESLTLLGYCVQTAADGRAGISQAVLSPPDLVLCDIMMPELDGYQVLEAIRDNRSLATLPFIFLSAKSDSLAIRRGMVQGADDYLTKPFSLDSLLAAITTRLQREAQRKADLQARLDAQRKTMSSVSSHEYNTALNGILGFADLLISDSSSFDQEETLSMLEMIKLSGTRLKRTLDNTRLIHILQHLTSTHELYPHFSGGQSLLTPQTVAKCFQAVSYRLDQDVSCQWAVETATVQISQENLNVILEELLDNAVKFSARGQVITVKGQSTKAGYQLSIQNTGQVFQEEDIAQLAPYRQFGRQQHEQQGIGVGLSIVGRLLAVNAGHFTITSNPTGQTTVTVFLAQ